MSRTCFRRWVLGTAVSLAGFGLALANCAQWRVVKPSNTGIPGEQLRFVRWAPDGALWVAARWPFWGEGGVGVYDFSADAWTTFANWETPIPSDFVNDVAFAADGSAWIASNGGLVHKSGVNWTVYTAANSPLENDEVGDVSIAPDGHLWVNNSGPAGGFVFEYDGVNWTKFAITIDLPWSGPWGELSDVLAGRDGRIWVTHAVLDGVAEYDGTSWTLHGDGVVRFGNVEEDQTGNLWMLAGVGGGPLRSTTTAPSTSETGRGR